MKMTIGIALTFLVGILLFSYPYLASYLSEVNGSYAVESYREGVEQTDSTQIEAAWQEAVKYNDSLSGSPVRDPFVAGSGMVMQDNYYEVLNLYDSMGFIEIPKIRVELPIYHGTSEAVLQKGSGHLEGSSLPIGGEGTHSVLTGHSGLVHAKIFTDLSELERGDLFLINVLDRVAAYEVDQIQVVEPNDTQNLKRVPGEDYCTLITCTPYGVNSHRLLVRGTRVEYAPQTETPAQVPRGLTSEQRLLLAAAGIASVVVLSVMAVAVKKTRRKK